MKDQVLPGTVHKYHLLARQIIQHNIRVFYLYCSFFINSMTINPISHSRLFRLSSACLCRSHVYLRRIQAIQSLRIVNKCCFHVFILNSGCYFFAYWEA